MSLLIYALMYNIVCFPNVTYRKYIVITNILVYSMMNSRKHNIMSGLIANGLLSIQHAFMHKILSITSIKNIMYDIYYISNVPQILLI